LRRTAAIVALVLALVPLGCRDRRGPAPTPRPSAASGNGHNVLLVTIDTLRADHLGTYGYKRSTSPHIDALGRRGTVFQSAYTAWPKTRGSMVIMLTGRNVSRNGYSKTHPLLLDFNPTLATVLKEAGYVTAAIVDNPNVAAENGYAKGFDSYRETWEEGSLPTETDRMRAITDGGIAFLRSAPADRPFLLWLHYVNPHAPYTPPPPFDAAFLDAAAAGPPLKLVPDFHGGIPKRWAVRGQDRLGYYVAQYDGEIAAVDQEVGRLMETLQTAAAGEKTVVVLTSDHGESLGEHNYYFDHGEDLFEPSLAVPLVTVVPGGQAGVRSRVFASTLDVVPTILDAVKVSYPPDLGGVSLLGETLGKTAPGRERLFARNDRNLVAAWDRRYKIVGTPEEGGGMRYALYDRATDPAEMNDVSQGRPDELQAHRRMLELFMGQGEQEWAQTRRLIGNASGERKLSPEACQKLQSLGYVVAGCSP
jgi:arylsulfatase